MAPRSVALPRITTRTAEAAAARIGYRGDAERLRVGMQHELEHNDVTRGDLVKTAMIAVAHLRERRDYYERLEECMPERHTAERAVRNCGAQVAQPNVANNASMTTQICSRRCRMQSVRPLGILPGNRGTLMVTWGLKAALIG
jgi:hypothetical protein